MNKFKYYFILLTVTVIIFSCTKKDNPVVPVEPPRDYAVQYATDIADIEQYLKTNYITVVNHPGFADDQDVTITKIPDGGSQPSIYSYLNATTFPKLLSRDPSMNGITYKLYYLVLREGTGESPCNVDGVLTAYRGDYLQRTTATDINTVASVFFQENKYPQTFFTLFTTTEVIPIRAWSEILPQFKTGDKPIINANGTVTYNNFGAGVMFIPSGLGYFNSPPDSSIAAYAPLVFSFKMFALKRDDHDGDGIPDYQEDIDNNKYIYDYRNTLKFPTLPTVLNPDDTDKDGIPDFLDLDDDGDGYTTKFEINNPATGLPFPFADIPTCTSGKKNYLVNTCHP